MASIIAHKIINELEQIAESPLPKYGVVAGQSIAELYLRLKDIDIYTRVKDLDVYIDTGAKFYPKKIGDPYVDDSFLRYNIDTKEKVLRAISRTSSYLDTPIEHVSERSEIFNVIKSYDYENINVVHCKLNTFRSIGYFDFLKKVVENFDINSVKIGICLKTKRLYISDDFKNFLKTRQVKIVKYERLASSFLRIANKRAHYKGAFFDMDYEANLMLAISKYKKRLSHKSKMNITQEKYYSLDKEVQDLIEKYFIIKPKQFELFEFLNVSLSSFEGEEEWRHYSPFSASYTYEKIEKFLSRAIGNEFSIDFIKPKLNYFNPKLNDEINFANKHLAEFYKKVKDYKYENPHLKNTPIMRKFIFNTPQKRASKNVIILKSKMLKLVEFIPRENRNLYSPVLKQNLSRLKLKKHHSVFKNLVSTRTNMESLFSQKKIRQLLSLKDKDESRYFFTEKLLAVGINISTNKISNRTISALMKHEKILNKLIVISKHRGFIGEEIFEHYANSLIFLEKNKMSIVIGMIETGKVPLEVLLKNEKDLESLSQNIQKLKNKSVPKISDDALLFNGYRIKHINETAELENVGNEMGHCVGGYGNVLRSLGMLFFDVYNERKERRTLSVEFKIAKGLPVLSVDQYYGRFNRPPSKIDRKSIIKFVENLQDSLLEEEILKQKIELINIGKGN